MRLSTWLVALLFSLMLGYVPALAQDELDCVIVDPAHHSVVFENDQVRVVRWVIPAGDTTADHSHPNNLNIALTDYNGKVTITPDGKTSEVHAKAGSVIWRQAGSHVVENLTSQAMEGIIVEPKEPDSFRPAGARDPVEVDPKDYKVEFENEQIRVIRERRDSGKTPMHGHPDNVQVLLTDMRWIITTAGGKTEAVSGKAGEVRWRSATQHVVEALGDKPIEQILIEMKKMPVAPWNPS